MGYVFLNSFSRRFLITPCLGNSVIGHINDITVNSELLPQAFDLSHLHLGHVRQTWPSYDITGHIPCAVHSLCPTEDSVSVSETQIELGVVVAELQASSGDERF